MIAPSGRSGYGEETERRHGQFVITEASEVMAVLALAKDHTDLRERLGRILVGLTKPAQRSRPKSFDA